MSEQLMTADELAAAFTAAGIDTPEKVTAILGYADKVLTRMQLSYAYDASLVERDRVATEQNAKVAAAKSALDAKDAELAAG